VASKTSSKPKPGKKSKAPSDSAAGSGAPANSGAVYRIADAARIADVSPTTVRVWERNGLLGSHRGSNGYRYFNEADLQRLRRIAHLRRVEHLNTEGIRRALADTDDDHDAPSASNTDPPIGPRLRKLRRDAGMTLGQAAEKAELSPSFLSALERDQTGVSSQSLHRLVHAYGSTFSTLMRHETAELVQLSGEGKRVRTSMHGADVETLINGQTLLDAELITVDAGVGTGTYTHEGEEILYMLDGELDVRLGSGQRYKLRPGESLFYVSTIEHEWSNSGSVPARFLWVATPPTW
jgi:DNA-binding transcriptional MerR regulator/mannose-6-phosphate isomerase-like protein (cupin superfamily)